MALDTARSGITLRHETTDTDDEHRLGATPAEGDGPIWMVDLTRHREVADHPDGTDAEPSGREAGLSDGDATGAIR